MATLKTVNIRIFHGGEFILVNGFGHYMKGRIELLRRVRLEEINYTYLFFAAKKLVKENETAVVWYKLPNLRLESGMDYMRSDDDIPNILRTIDRYGMLDLYVRVETTNPFLTCKGSPRTKRPLSPLHPIHKPFVIRSPPKASPPKSSSPQRSPPTLLKPKQELIPLRSSPRLKLQSTSTSKIPLRKSPRHLPSINVEDDDIIWTTTNPLISTHQPLKQPPNYKTPQTRSKLPIKKKVNLPSSESSQIQPEPLIVIPLATADKNGVVKEFKEAVRKGKQVETVKNRVQGEKSGLKVVVEKGKRVEKSGVSGVECRQSVEKEKEVSEGVKLRSKAKNKQVKEDPAKNRDKSRKKQKEKGTKKKKRSKVDLFADFDEEDVFDDAYDTDSDCPPVDIEFELGEEDKSEEELFEEGDKGDILGQVNGSLRNEKKFDFDISDHESDELISIEGSDEEGDNAPVFDSFTDFRRDINLVLGLKFANNDVLRKALRHHSVEKTYDYYYLQNDNRRVTTYCRYKCNCEWSKKKGRIVGCKCEKLICNFKVHARKLKREETFQIKAMNLRHTCNFDLKSKKVTSEYLATRFLEDWRENPYWKVKVFQAHVKRKTGFVVPYARCWVARARAKMMIYGDGADQYLRVWDYAAILRKQNPGSSTFVKVERIERPPPLFQRMYICLKACKDGFLAGCRPLIGVDGCHLKGAYPGMCLVAVGKDGNNNIYPIAWAVVEVENKETWSWFLRLLVEDLIKGDGDGLTFMSDRQKGLLDAFDVVTPKADLRFCVRHIWANFKLQWAGQAYKDAFWTAARTTSKVQFDDTMAAIKALNPDAYAYLAAIPPRHWSRHAFSTTCKSNMLLNNICESFNAVLKEARDKPILTFMEWIRRYVMRTRNEKKNGVLGLDGILMPYVAKYLKWAEEESRLCTFIPGNNEEYEVDHRGDTYVVDLAARTCGCKHWELSGIPCAHAVACIMSRRKDPKTFVDEAYSKRRYMMAYEPSIAAMPGIKQWPKVDQPQPQPPAFRKLPGRPNLRKRRKEAEEGTSKQVKRARKQRACSRCGNLGHNNRTCNKDPIVKEAPTKAPTFRRKATGEWSVKEREKRAKRKVAREAYVAARLSAPAAAAGTSAPQSAATTAFAPHSTAAQPAPAPSSQSSVNGGETMAQVRRRLGYE